MRHATIYFILFSVIHQAASREEQKSSKKIINKPACLERWEHCMAESDPRPTAADCDELMNKRFGCPKPKPWNRGRTGDYDYVLTKESVDTDRQEDVIRGKYIAKEKSNLGLKIQDREHIANERGAEPERRGGRTKNYKPAANDDFDQKLEVDSSRSNGSNRRPYNSDRLRDSKLERKDNPILPSQSRRPKAKNDEVSSVEPQNNPLKDPDEDFRTPRRHYNGDDKPLEDSSIPRLNKGPKRREYERNDDFDENDPGRLDQETENGRQNKRNKSRSKIASSFIAGLFQK